MDLNWNSYREHLEGPVRQWFQDAHRQWPTPPLDIHQAWLERADAPSQPVEQLQLLEEMALWRPDVALLHALLEEWMVPLLEGLEGNEFQEVLFQAKQGKMNIAWSGGLGASPLAQDWGFPVTWNGQGLEGEESPITGLSQQGWVAQMAHLTRDSDKVVLFLHPARHLEGILHQGSGEQRLLWQSTPLRPGTLHSEPMDIQALRPHWSRLLRALSSVALGCLRSSLFGMAKAFAKTPERSRSQAYQWPLADASTELDAARLLTWRAATESFADSQQSHMAFLTAISGARKAFQSQGEVSGQYEENGFPASGHIETLRRLEVLGGPKQFHLLEISKTLSSKAS